MTSLILRAVALSLSLIVGLPAVAAGQCKISDLEGWWISSMTDGKYSLVCRSFLDRDGNALAETSSCEIADRGSDDDHYVVNDSLSEVRPAFSDGYWEVFEGEAGCEVAATYVELRGTTTFQLTMDERSRVGAGWGRYPQGDLFGVTVFRSSSRLNPFGVASTTPRKPDRDG